MTDFKLIWNKHISRRAGFTILELLVAMALLAIVVSIVYMTFSTVIQSTEDARAASFEIRTRQFLARSFTANLTQATEGWLPGAAYRGAELAAPEGSEDVPAIGSGKTRYWLDGTSDSLTFVSTAPLAGATGLPGYTKLVTYEVIYEGTEEEGHDLLTDFGLEPEASLEVRETPLALSGSGLGVNLGLGDFTREDVTESAEMIGMESVGWDIPIESLEFQYFDGENWLDSWDSSESGRLPWAVDIRINFPVSPEEEFATGFESEKEPDVHFVFTIPAGAGIRDEPPDYVRPTESRRDGIG